MPKLEKLLKKLTQKEQDIGIYLITELLNRKWSKLDIKKLKGHRNVYRVRKGNLRIIFIDIIDDIEILSIARRNEKTYKIIKE